MIIWWIPYVCLFLTALVVALVTTPFARKLAWRCGAIDCPSKRRINKQPIPRMGGLAIFCALIAAVTMQYFGTKVLGWPVVLLPRPTMVVNYYLLALSFLIIFVTGLLDDIYQLKPIPKLMGQILGACVAVYGGLSISEIVNPLGGEFSLGWIGFPLTVLYLVAFVNIMNFIDGLDGLASGITCISCFTLCFMATISNRLDAAALSISVAGATLGFLRYNFHPASIFLGDSGSLLLGFSLGTISLLNVTRMAGLTTMIIPLIISFVPIVDTFSAIIRRRRARVSVGHADTGHIHHRLIDDGYNQRQAVLLIYAWTVVLCAGAVLMTQIAVPQRILTFCILIGLSCAVAAHLKLFEPVLRHHYNPTSGADELVGPDDPAFVEEEKKAEQHHEQFVDSLLKHDDDHSHKHKHDHGHEKGPQK